MKELSRRLLFLLVALLVYRLGVHIPVPGIRPERVASLFEGAGATFLGLFNLFSGGALKNFSVLALGVVPYISSSIVMQLLQAVLPSVKQMRKEGEKGRRKLTNYTRLLTLILALIQSFTLAKTMQSQGVFFEGYEHILVILSTFSVAAGTMFLVWLGEEITERGVGNGISMLIFFGIVGRLPQEGYLIFDALQEGSANILSYLLILILLFLSCLAIIAVERAQRQIPITHSSRDPLRGNASASSTFPLKVNLSGVIPAIFASSVLLLPYSAVSWLGASASPWLQNLALLLSPGQLLYTAVFVVAVIFFAFFYSTMVFNPKEIADNLKRSNAFIPGIRPGAPTAEFFERTILSLTVIGGSYIALISLLPQIVSAVTKTQLLFAGTSVLITIVVAMDFMAQVQTHLFSAQYGSVLSRANLTNRRSY